MYPAFENCSKPKSKNKKYSSQNYMHSIEIFMLKEYFFLKPNIHPKRIFQIKYNLNHTVYS